MPKKIIPSRYKQTSSLSKSHLEGSSYSNSSSNSMERSKKAANLKDTLGVERKHLLPSPAMPLKTGKLNSDSNKIPKFQTPKLHSTAIFSKSPHPKMQSSGNKDDIFSSTVMSGIASCSKGGFNKVYSDSDLPDLSTLSVIGVNENNLSPMRKLSTRPESDVISEKDLQGNYLEYLTWMYLDLKSQETYKAQIAKRQNQIKFLKKIISDKEEELGNEKLKLHIFRHYEKANTMSESLKDLIEKFKETASEMAPTLDLLSKNLEMKLNHFNLKEIYSPTDSIAYAENLREVISIVAQEISSINKEKECEHNLLLALSNIQDSLMNLLKELESDFKFGEDLVCSTLKDLSHVAGRVDLELKNST